MAARRAWQRISPMTRHQARFTPTLVITGLAVVWVSFIVPGHGSVLWVPLAEAIFLVPFIATLRGMRAGVYADRDRLRVRSMLRTRTVRLADVASVDSAPRSGDQFDPRRSDAFRIVLKSGEIVRTPVRILNPAEGSKPYGAAYEREEFVRIGDHLRAIVRNYALDDTGS